MKLHWILTSGYPLPEIRKRLAEWALLGMARKVPRRLAYWVLIAEGSRHFGNDVVPEVRFMTVLQRSGDAL